MRNMFRGRLLVNFLLCRRQEDINAINSIWRATAGQMFLNLLWQTTKDNPQSN